MHVDFAHARDDQYEWECKQRQIQREQRHRERLMRDNDRDVSPSAPSHFTESEANSVLEKLKGWNRFLSLTSRYFKLSMFMERRPKFKPTLGCPLISETESSNLFF